MLMRTIPIFLTFLVMGVADAMGPMSDAVQRQYRISSVTATLLSFFVFIAFAVFSVPGGLLAARIGKKKLLLLGLGLNAIAMFVPTVMVPGFALLLTCIFLLGVGTTFLQVAGNPIMRDVSPEGAYSRNLAWCKASRGSAARDPPTWSAWWPRLPCFNRWGGVDRFRCSSCSWPRHLSGSPPCVLTRQRRMFLPASCRVSVCCSVRFSCWQ